MADKNEEETVEVSTEISPETGPISDEEQLLKAVHDGKSFIYSLAVRNLHLRRCFVR